ncbi:hypothetical protein OPV22_016110 [Ensete ventricosum]|uniref:R13L1/DRL21-like LRR repeat region domain-containing protein n=1 Tax=Ensete ventricosum TaxID=4639 RepID=A0AAV8PDY1_ENSVE|nr:hypothetical protein OPV22_016110 [Ensete ventricosum]
MRELRGQLSITNLDMVGSATECTKTRLDNKEHLNASLLFWRQSERRDNNPDNHEKGWEALLPLGLLLFLRILHQISLKAVKHIGPGFYGDNVTTFSSLEELLFSDMIEWRQWSGIETSHQLFPRLCRLHINRCHKLRGSLVMPTLLEKLHVVFSDDPTWESHEKPEVILSDVIWDLRETKDNSSILKLSIDNISLLTDCLPAESLSSVHRLDVIYCSSLVFFTDE